MGILSALFGSPIEDVKSALAKFQFGPGLSEVKFRDALTKHVSTALKASPKREAGLRGLGTKIDLYFEHRNEDFMVSIKQGLSEQKAKVLLGEALVIAQSTVLDGHPRRTNIVILIMTDTIKDEAFDGHLQPLLAGLAFLDNALAKMNATPEVHFHLGFAEAGKGIELMSL